MELGEVKVITSQIEIKLLINTNSSLIYSMIKTLNLTKSALNSIEELGYDYTDNNDTISVDVYDLDYDLDHYLIDPDKQLCFQYGINHDHLVSIN